MGLTGFVAAILGGWGSSWGAVLGGLALGIIESIFAGVVPAGCRRTLSPSCSSSWSCTSGLTVCWERPPSRVRNDGDQGAHHQAYGSAQGLRATLKSGSFLFKLIFSAALLIWPLVIQNTYDMSIMATAGLYAMLTVAVGLILGQAGQLSFGHSAFYGIGAYVCGDPGPDVPLDHGDARSSARSPPLWSPSSSAGRAQAEVLLPGAGHHRPGPDLPGVVVTQLQGGAQWLQPGPSVNLFGFELTTYPQYYVIWVVVIVVLLFVSRDSSTASAALRALATARSPRRPWGCGRRTGSWSPSSRRHVLWPRGRAVRLHQRSPSCPGPSASPRRSFPSS